MSVTPAAHELPEIISVDDHIVEPRELWQDELPAGVRERGPHVVREKVSLHFEGGHYAGQPTDAITLSLHPISASCQVCLSVER